VNSNFVSHRFCKFCAAWLSVVLFAFALCGPVQGQTPGQTTDPAQRPSQAPGGKTSQSAPLQIKPRTPETEVIRLRAGELPEVTLTSNVLFRILAAEIAAQRGSYLAAGTTLLELARETSDPRIARRSLEFYLAGGNITGALDAAKIWLRISPSDDEAVSTELALGAAAGQTAGLAEALRKRIDKATDKTIAINQAISTLARMKNRAEAFSIFSEAINQSTVRNLLSARLALADMAQAAGDPKQALLEARIALGANPRSEEAAVRVLEYGIATEPDTVLKEAKAFAQRHPEARRLRLGLAGQLSDQGNYEGAAAEVASMIARTPEDFELLYVQAQLAARAKRFDQARQFLDQYITVQKQRQRAAPEGATDADAALSEGYQLRARVAQEQGRLDDAIADLVLITEPDSIYFGARMRQALIRGQQGRIDEALALIDSTEAQDDESATLGVMTATQILRNAKRLDDAIKRLEDADRLRPQTVAIKYELGMLYESQNNLPAAEKAWRQVIALDPGYGHAYNALGYALADRNVRLQEAQTLIARALELMPNDPFVMDSMGWVKFRLGDNTAAFDYLSRAYKLRPEADIAAHLGEVLWQQGKREQAIVVWREGLAKEAGNSTLVETLKRFGVKP
jgi:tetratricopeptide (TPR) repeat protein